MSTETLEDVPSIRRGSEGAPRPGLVVVWAGERAQCLVLALDGDAIELGRDELAAAQIPDGRVSHRHVRIARDGDRWSVKDEGSRNGTFVDGRQVQSARQLSAPVVRIGRTLLLPVADVLPFESPGIAVRGGIVLGPSLAALHERIGAIARSGTSLLLLGESGSGKESAAAAFHAAARGERKPLVAVNCATIPKELAERTLFGARRGAYTGAQSDAEGLIQAADGGTLFLDEIAELEPAVQAKLLRVLETKEVLPLGAVHAVAVDVRVCAATHQSLRAEVADGRFREDLYFRVGRPELRIPPLRERREEIPWLIERALAALPPEGRLGAGVELVEACLLRSWPGNVRELLAEIATAAVAASAAKRISIAAADLDPEAGRSLRPSGPVRDDRDGGGASEPAGSEERAEVPLPEPAAIEEALRAEQGNVARAAARLGVSRSRLRRFIEREGIDIRALRPL